MESTSAPQTFTAKQELLVPLHIARRANRTKSTITKDAKAAQDAAQETAKETQSTGSLFL